METQLLREQLAKMELQCLEKDYKLLERDYRLLEIDYNIQRKSSGWVMAVDCRVYLKLRECKRRLREMVDRLREDKRREMQDKRREIMEETIRGDFEAQERNDTRQ